MKRPRSLRHQLVVVILIAILGGTGEALTGGSVHDGIGYGIAVLTGVFLGLGLAKR